MCEVNINCVTLTSRKKAGQTAYSSIIKKNKKIYIPFHNSLF